MEAVLEATIAPSAYGVEKSEVAARADLSVTVGGLRLSNPVMPASGCFGPELAPLLPIRELGAVVTKTVFAERRAGNPAHRLTETPYGMLNSVGIPSPGSVGFRGGLLREYQAMGVPVIVSIGGLFTNEYFHVAEDLADEDIAAFEVNVSCPNLEHGGLAIGTSPELVAEVVAGIRTLVNRPLFVKLTPSVTSIADIAQAAQDAGAAALTVCNSFSGLAINIDDRTNALGNGAGGYTGPAVKPLALRLVRDAVEAVRIPVIGCGGISSARDVAEFLIAGASAVQVGTATFTRPYTMAQIINDLTPLCQQLGVERITDLVGTLDVPSPTGSIA
ncbi:MAG: dihydroorotate dehydrogenase [Lacisediminihabitans sp.]